MDENGKINSQEEYDKYLEEFNKKLKSFGVLRAIRTDTSVNDFCDMFDKAESIGLFDHDFCVQQKQKLYDGLSNQKTKDKIKYLFKKKGLTKWASTLYFMPFYSC